MVLARDVVDGRGRLLIPAGNELTERHVAALRMWGIPYIDVEGDDVVEDGSASLAPELLEAAERLVAERFAIAGSQGPFLERLRAQAVIRTARSLDGRAGRKAAT